MYYDSLILALIAITPITYRADCEEKFPDRDNVPAYHIVTNLESHINFCRDITDEYIVHEVGHEIHHIIRTDPDFEIYVNAFQKLHDMSSSDGDYVSQYAQTNVNEDFAETIEYFYQRNKTIPDIVEPDWISSGVSNVQRTKFLLIDIIIKKLQEDDRF